MTNCIPSVTNCIPKVGQGHTPLTENTNCKINSLAQRRSAINFITENLCELTTRNNEFGPNNHICNYHQTLTRTKAEMLTLEYKFLCGYTGLLRWPECMLMNA